MYVDAFNVKPNNNISKKALDSNLTQALVSSNSWSLPRIYNDSDYSKESKVLISE